MPARACSKANRPVVLGQPSGPAVVGSHPAGPKSEIERPAHDGWRPPAGPIGAMATRHEPVEPNGVTAIRRAFSPRGHRCSSAPGTAASLGFAERVVAKRLPEGDFHDWTAIEAWAAGIARALPAHRTAPR